MKSFIHFILEKFLKTKKSAPSKNWRALLERSIQDFENRKIYNVLNPDILKEIPDDRLEQVVIDFVELKVESEIGDDAERFYDVIKTLPKSFQAIYTTFYLEAEVYNGGISQYFSNPTGLFTREAIEGLKMVEAYKLAQVIGEAVKIDKGEVKVKKNGKSFK